MKCDWLKLESDYIRWKLQKLYEENSDIFLTIVVANVTLQE